MARIGPIRIELDPGRYHWCACGTCPDAPLSDGACAGDRPAVPFELTEPTRIRLCRCRHTSNPPYCDGSHYQVAEDEAG